MPPVKSKHVPNGLRAASSTLYPKSAVKFEHQEVTIPSQQFSVQHPISPVNTSKPKSKAYYAIKPEIQELISPTQKVPAPYLTPAVRQELWAIWKSEPRVPTVASRYAWAVSRNADPTRVHHWFCSRRRCAKEAGQLISHETYELSLEPRAVPVTLEAKKDIISPTSSSSSWPVCYSKMTDVDLSSDDTLVSFGADCSQDKNQCYVPNRYSLSPALSVMYAPTVTPTPTVTPEHMEGHAYMRHYAQESRTLTPEAIDSDEQKANCNKYAPRYALQDRARCLNDAYTAAQRKP